GHRDGGVPLVREGEALPVREPAVRPVVVASRGDLEDGAADVDARRRLALVRRLDVRERQRELLLEGAEVDADRLRADGELRRSRCRAGRAPLDGDWQLRLDLEARARW